VAQVAGLLVVEIDAAAERLEHAGDHARVGPRRQGALLRAAQLGRRDHLHGLGDLPRVFHAADAAPEIEYVCHFSSSVLSSVLSGQFLRASPL
jgi:hypothetical protein